MIPIVAISAYSADHMAYEVFAAGGCNDYLQKPLDPELIWAALDRYLTLAFLNSFLKLT